MDIQKDDVKNPLSAWLDVKVLIDAQSEAQDFARQNLEKLICEVADVCN